MCKGPEAEVCLACLRESEEEQRGWSRVRDELM